MNARRRRFILRTFITWLRDTKGEEVVTRSEVEACARGFGVGFTGLVFALDLERRYDVQPYRGTMRRSS